MSRAMLAQDRTSARLRSFLYGLVTTIVVLLLTTAEWWTDRSLSHASRVASTLVEVAIVLVVALTFRQVHMRAEGALEAAFTRRRREARKALFSLAREVTHFKEPAQMMRRIVDAIDLYVAPGGCAIYLRSGDYRAAVSSFAFEVAVVAKDDALVTQLRSTAAAVNPRAVHSNAPGTMACPMTAGGELIGFVVFSAGIDELEADDRQTLTALSESAGLALAALDPSLSEPSAESRLARSAGNLPHEVDAFVGRGAELAQLAALLEHHRLVCLKGPGGIGKSRLAVRCAANASSAYSDGAWFIDLSSAENETEMLGAATSSLRVAQTAGKTQLENLVDSLAERRAMLVIDNCEHLLGAVSRMVNELLRACPGVTVLATSREPLNVGGEAIFEVPTLPADQAMALFRDRAAAVSPNLDLSEHEQSIYEIVTHLDGIAFAIELAAARLRMLSPRQLAERIDNRFQLLTGGSRTALPRQQTLRAMIDWSYELLSQPEQTLFARLSIFPATFALDAVTEICSTAAISDADAVGHLGHLIDKSLVQVEAGPDGQRFRLLESTQAYARELLEPAAAAELSARHAAYYTHMAVTIVENTSRSNYDLGLERLKVDVDNVYAAMDWALANERLDLAVDTASHLAMTYWFHYTQLRTGREWLSRVMQHEAQMTPAQRAATHFGYANMLLFSDTPQALASARLAASLARETDDKLLLANALTAAGNAGLSLGDSRNAQACYEESIRLFDELGSDNARVMRINLACVFINFHEEEFERAQSLLEDALASAKNTGRKGHEGIIYGNMAQLAYLQGYDRVAYDLGKKSVAIAHELGAVQQEAVWQYSLAIYAANLRLRDEAAAALREAIAICREYVDDDPEHVSGCLEAVMVFASITNRSSQAAHLHGFVERFREERNVPRPPVFQTRHDRLVTAIRSALNARAFEAARSAGATASPNVILDEAEEMVTGPAPRTLSGYA